LPCLFCWWVPIHEFNMWISYPTRRVPLVEQELSTLPEHLSSPSVLSSFRVTRSLVLCVCFVDRCLSFCTFSFGHCVVCSSIYGFWLPLWCILAIVLSVHLRLTDSDYPFGVFWPLCCLFFFDLRILITPLVSLNSSKSSMSNILWKELFKKLLLYNGAFTFLPHFDFFGIQVENKLWEKIIIKRWHYSYYYYYYYYCILKMLSFIFWWILYL
jgi:hypothetical protein